MEDGPVNYRIRGFMSVEKFAQKSPRKKRRLSFNLTEGVRFGRVASVFSDYCLVRVSSCELVVPVFMTDWNGLTHTKAHEKEIRGLQLPLCLFAHVDYPSTTAALESDDSM